MWGSVFASSDINLKILGDLPKLQCLILGFDFIPGQAILIEDVGSSEFLRFQGNSMQVPIMVAWPLLIPFWGNKSIQWSLKIVKQQMPPRNPNMHTSCSQFVSRRPTAAYLPHVGSPVIREAAREMDAGVADRGANASWTPFDDRVSDSRRQDKSSC